MTLSRGRVAQLPCCFIRRSDEAAASAVGANVAGLQEEVAERESARARERARESETRFIDNHEVTESDGGELNPEARGDRMTPSRGSVVQLI